MPVAPSSSIGKGTVTGWIAAATLATATITALVLNLATFTEGAAPSTPASGKVALYAKADGLLYSKDDAGTETLVSGGAGGGSFDPDAATVDIGTTVATSTLNIGEAAAVTYLRSNSIYGPVGAAFWFSAGSFAAPGPPGVYSGFNIELNAGASVGTGTGGTAKLVGGASDGATGTAGNAYVDTGHPNGGTPGNANIGTTWAAQVNIGNASSTTTVTGATVLDGTVSMPSGTAQVAQLLVNTTYGIDAGSAFTPGGDLKLGFSSDSVSIGNSTGALGYFENMPAARQTVAVSGISASLGGGDTVNLSQLETYINSLSAKIDELITKLGASGYYLINN